MHPFDNCMGNNIRGWKHVAFAAVRTRGAEPILVFSRTGPKVAGTHDLPLVSCKAAVGLSERGDTVE